MSAVIRDQRHRTPRCERHRRWGYFKRFAELLKTNMPYPDDAPMVAKLGTLGIVPGQDFDIAKLDPASAQALAKAPKAALQRIAGREKNGVAVGDWRLENGWAITTKAGLFGTDYVQRALIAMIGLYANRPQDSIYPVSAHSLH